MTPRRLLALCVLLTLTGCASMYRAATGSPSEDRGSSDPSPGPTGPPADVAVVECYKDRVVLENPVVRAQRDGVRFVIENRGGVWGFELRHVTDPNVAWNSGPIGPGTTRLTDSSAPGEVLVACLRARDRDAQGSWYHDDDAPTARLTIVDPDGLYVPWEPVCGFGEQSRMKIDVPKGEEPAEAFRRVPGVRPSDEFRTPKYPESPQYWPTVMVFREGEAVARLMGPRIGNVWELLINACPGSGIAGA